MNTEQILQQLREERDRLTRAIDALEGGSSRTSHNPGRRTRGISAAGRKRLSELMKKRWAERRKKAAK